MGQIVLHATKGTVDHVRDTASSNLSQAVSQMGNTIAGINNSISGESERAKAAERELGARVAGIIANVTKSGNKATIVITDGSGHQTIAEISDGGKGDKGDKGDRGIQGPAGDGSYVYDLNDEKWHLVTVWTDPTTGEKTTNVNPVGITERPTFEAPEASISESEGNITLTTKDVKHGTNTVTFKGMTNHASTHATGGSDAITLADIGAAAAAHVNQHKTGGTDALAPADIGAAPATHVNQHKTGGTDALAPADIGAAPAAHVNQHKTGGTDALAPADIGAAAATHASTHATGGADAITPSDIGAATGSILNRTVTINGTSLAIPKISNFSSGTETEVQNFKYAIVSTLPESPAADTIYFVIG